MSLGEWIGAEYSSIDCTTSRNQNLGLFLVNCHADDPCPKCFLPGEEDMKCHSLPFILEGMSWHVPDHQASKIFTKQGDFESSMNPHRVTNNANQFDMSCL